MKKNCQILPLLHCGKSSTYKWIEVLDDALRVSWGFQASFKQPPISLVMQIR